MARTDSLTNWMTDIANSIREKTKKTDSIPAANFDTEIGSIESNDTSLEDGLVTRTLTEYTNDRVTNIGKYNFYYSDIKTFDFPNVTKIGQRAFYNSTMESINIPNVQDIGVYSFYKCPNITKIDMPLLTSLGGYDFTECSNLTEINLPKITKSSIYMASRCTSLIEVNMPLLTEVVDYTFCDCTSLTEIDLPKVSRIAHYTFQNCSNLETVNLGKTISFLGTYAFEDCSKLQNIDFSKITYLNSYSFRRCSSLENVSMPNLSGSNSSSSPFYDCTGLKLLDLPKVTDLYSSSSFAGGCTSLERINLPLLTGGLGTYCFSTCTSLTKIELPLITKFKAGVFYNCANLKTVVLRGQTIPSAYSTGVFEGTPIESGDGYIYVPSDMVTGYQNANNLFEYSDKYIGINEDTSVLVGNSFTPSYIGEDEISNWDMITLTDNVSAEINTSTGTVITNESGNILIRGLDVDGNILHVVYLSIVNSEEV